MDCRVKNEVRDDLNVNLEVMVAGNDEEFAASLKNALLDVGCKHSVKSAATFNEFKNYLRKIIFILFFLTVLLTFLLPM